MHAPRTFRTLAAILGLAAVAAPSAALAAKPVRHAAPPKHAKAVRPVITRFSPASAKPNAKITVYGLRLTGVELVRIGATKAAFRAEPGSRLSVTIPAKAHSGRIAVVTKAGTARSAHMLKVA